MSSIVNSSKALPDGDVSNIASTSTSAIDYSGPRLILGTSTLSSANSKDLTGLLQSLSNLPISITSIDTAPFYPSQNPGHVESLLGSAIQEVGLEYEIHTKTMVISKPHPVPGTGELHSKKVRESIQGSAQRLKKPKLKTLLAARPDQEATIGEIAGIFSAKVHEGRCDQWGVCNFSATQLRDLIRTAEKRGWHAPKVYQGHYSALHRKRAEEVLDVVEQYSMEFVASHSQTALKSGAPTSRQNVNGIATNGTANLNVFGMPEAEETIRVLKAIETWHKISPREVSLRWLAYHSRLRPVDGIVLEPATSEELKADVEAIAKGPLPDEILKEVNRAWRAEEDDAVHGR